MTSRGVGSVQTPRSSRGTPKATTSTGTAWGAPVLESGRRGGVTDYPDRVHFRPVIPEFVSKITERERPDCIFYNYGGQTALNCAVRLEAQGSSRSTESACSGRPWSARIAEFACAGAHSSDHHYGG